MTAQLSLDELRSLAVKKVESLKFAITQSAFTSIRQKLEEELQLAEFALAGMDSEPVATLDVQSGRPDGKKFALVYSSAAHKLPDDVYYLHTAPPAPVADSEYGDAYQGAREDLSIWKRRALEAEGEVRRLGEINDYLVKQAQGESRMGEPLIRETAPVAVPDFARLDSLAGEFLSNAMSHNAKVRDAYTWCAHRLAETVRDCRAAMLNAGAVTAATVLLDYVQVEYDGREWAAQLAEANHPQTGDWLYDDPIELAKAIRKGPDMPSMAAPDQQNSQQNIPEIIPGGLVEAVNNLLNNDGSRGCYSAIGCGEAREKIELWLAQRQKWESQRSENLCAVNSPVIPDGWIPCSERMPEDDDFVYVWPRPDFGVELHVGQYCECHPKGDGWYAQVYEQHYGIEWHQITVTHWMPLPAAPEQEV